MNTPILRSAGSNAVGSAVLVAMLAAWLRPAGAQASAADCGNATCCQTDASCDDGDVCTVDRCAAAGACRHDPLGFDDVRDGIAAAVAADTCASQLASPAPGRLLEGALGLVDRASASRRRRQTLRLLRTTIRRLRTARRRIDAAIGLAPACAGGVDAAIGTAAIRAQCLLNTVRSPVAGPAACLAQSGPRIDLSGTRSRQYSDRTLAPDTRIDARAAVFLASPSNHYPISLGGGAGACFVGGSVHGEYDRTLSWSAMHDMNNAGIVFANPTTVDGIRIDDVEDGIRPRGKGPFTVRNAWLSYIRDDCVENDHVEGGLIDDSLFDGCYVAISERPSPSIAAKGFDGRGDALTIRHSLIRLAPMPGPRGGRASDLGNGQFFKWSDRATDLALIGNVFMAEQVSQEGGDTMGIPSGLASCADNVMVWLGPGAYPAPLPDCVRVTRDGGVWDAAVADWKRRHPDVGR